MEMKTVEPSTKEELVEKIKKIRSWAHAVRMNSGRTNDQNESYYLSQQAACLNITADKLMKTR